MSGPTSTDPAQPGPQQAREAELLTHIRLLQGALDETTHTEADLAGAERRIAALLAQIDHLTAQNIACQRTAEALRHDVARLESSLSWRVTAPLRWLRQRLHRILRHARRSLTPDRPRR